MWQTRSADIIFESSKEAYSRRGNANRVGPSRTDAGYLFPLTVTLADTLFAQIFAQGTTSAPLFCY